jgi:hypothetical protein
VPPVIEPPELARLVDFAERPRQRDWSLRSALVRYAQPEPERVGRVLELLRRIEAAIQSHRKVVEREGDALWAALETGTSPPADVDAAMVELLRVTTTLDDLGDTLAAWAVDPAQPQPDAAVDAATTAIAGRLDDLGVPREERPPERATRGGRRPPRAK